MTDILDALINFAALALLSAGTAGVGVLAPRVAGWLRLAHDDRVRAYLLAAVEDMRRAARAPRPSWNAMGSVHGGNAGLRGPAA